MRSEREANVPQEAWSRKDERQYEKIKRSEKERGRSDERAEEIAVRTVNKRRQREGRPSQKRSSGAGNPNTPLDERTVNELRNRAKELGISGRSKMNRAELVKAIRRR